MSENNFTIDNINCESTHNKYISKNLVNYYFQKYTNYIGKRDKVFFFQKYNYDINYIIVYIQQFFALNGQMKIFKKWHVINFKNIVFMHKSNKFIASYETQIFINKIDCFYDLNIAQVIFTQEQWPDKAIEQHLVLSQNDNLIVVSRKTTIYFLIDEDNGNWMLQQRERIGFDNSTYILDIQLNDEGNILIVSFTQIGFSIFSANVFLRADKYWKTISNFSFQLSSQQQYCFLDNQRFLISSVDDYQIKLQIFQIFVKTFKVKQLQTQDLYISEGSEFSNLEKLRFLKKRSLLLAWRRPFIYAILQVNAEFKISSQIMSVQEGLIFRDIINEEWLVFNSSQYHTKTHRTQVSKLYEK